MSLISLSFPLQVSVESVHAGLPGALARLHPVDRLVEGVGLHAARPQLGVAAARDQSGALEHLEVARDRRQAHRERLRQLADGRLALRQAGQDRAARRVGERGEGEAELVGLHVTRRLNNVLVKYKSALQCDPSVLPGRKLSAAAGLDASPSRTASTSAFRYAQS